MFTGIIQAVGTVQQVTDQPFGRRLVVDKGPWDYQPRSGDSVAVNGVCLTCLPVGDRHLLGFDVVRQTLELTTLGRLRPGDRVNLESALTPTTPLGGHFVQGHVDGLGRLVQVQRSSEQARLTVEVEADLLAYLIPQGSVALDGVSLTIAQVDASARRFEVALIPTTLQATTLGQCRAGQQVNVETDILVRTVVRALEAMGRGGGLTMDQLRRAGFA